MVDNARTFECEQILLFNSKRNVKRRVWKILLMLWCKGLTLMADLDRIFLTIWIHYQDKSKLKKNLNKGTITSWSNTKFSELTSVQYSTADSKEIYLVTTHYFGLSGVEYQLGHRPVFFSSCQYYSAHVTNFNKVKYLYSWL